MPTLSQIEHWPTEHLDAASTYWTATARTWDEAFTTVSHAAPFPGGRPWDGTAADAAVRHVTADRLTVLGAVDTLHSAAAIARHGAAELQNARRLVLAAVAEAQAARFAVGEDLTVVDRVSAPPQVRAARMARAQRHSATIWSRAAALVTADNGIAARITHATAGLEENPFHTVGGRTPAPQGPIVWCLRQGVAGNSWRCSVLYPDGGTAWYWSNSDDSGGSL
jgi:hypothetical protein